MFILFFTMSGMMRFVTLDILSGQLAVLVALDISLNWFGLIALSSVLE